MSSIPVIRAANAIFQTDGRLPAKRRQTRGIEELARCAVGLGSIEFDVSLIADDILNEFCQFENADVLPPTDIRSGSGVCTLSSASAVCNSVVTKLSGTAANWLPNCTKPVTPRVERMLAIFVVPGSRRMKR